MNSNDCSPTLRSRDMHNLMYLCSYSSHGDASEVGPMSRGNQCSHRLTCGQGRECIVEGAFLTLGLPQHEVGLDYRGVELQGSAAVSHYVGPTLELGMAEGPIAVQDSLGWARSLSIEGDHSSHSWYNAPTWCVHDGHTTKQLYTCRHACITLLT